MTQLIQSKYVVEMIVERLGKSVGYARLMIFRAIHSGDLVAYKKSLKFGSRSIALFDPKEVERWLQGYKLNKKKIV